MADRKTSEKKNKSGGSKAALVERGQPGSLWSRVITQQPVFARNPSGVAKATRHMEPRVVSRCICSKGHLAVASKGGSLVQAKTCQFQPANPQVFTESLSLKHDCQAAPWGCSGDRRIVDRASETVGMEGPDSIAGQTRHGCTGQRIAPRMVGKEILWRRIINEKHRRVFRPPEGGRNQ